MAAEREGASLSEQYRFIVGSAGTRFAAVVAGLVLGLPVFAYLSGRVAAVFYVHVGLAALWFGMDFFLRYVLAPAVDAAGPETATTLTPILTPRALVVGESLTLGTVGSGIGLAHRLGYLADPEAWVWGALGIAAVMVFIAFVPLRRRQAEILLELDSPDPDRERVEDLGETTDRLLAVMTVLFLLVLVMMVGMRGLLG